MAEIVVVAPVAGQVVVLADVPDDIFANLVVGPGLAIDPRDAESMVAGAPIAGSVFKVMPHAYIIRGNDLAVLVHLGLDTVRLRGAGFTPLVAAGDAVQVGDPIIEWSPATLAADGYNPLVPVIALDVSPQALTALAAPGDDVQGGDPLFLVAS